MHQKNKALKSMKMEALHEITDRIKEYPAVRKDFGTSFIFSGQVRECYGEEAVQKALFHSVFSVSRFCTLVMQRRVVNPALQDEFRRLREDPTWRADHTHSVESFIQWVYEYVMEGADKNKVIGDLYALRMKTFEEVPDFTRRIEVQAGMATTVSNGLDYYSALPWILVQGLATHFNGWNLRNLVISQLRKDKLVYIQREIEATVEQREQHWGQVRTAAIEVAKNIPVAAAPRASSYQDLEVRSPTRPYNSVQHIAESVHSDKATAAIHVGTNGPQNPLSRVTRRQSWRSSRSKSPFRSATERGCFNYGKEGHLQAECPEPRKPPLCYNCGQPGHIAKECRELPLEQTLRLGRLPTQNGESARVFVRRVTVGSEKENESQTGYNGDGGEEGGTDSGEEAGSDSH
jgi:hypothetical protein